MQAVTRKQLAEAIGAQTLHVTDRAKLVKAVAGYLATEQPDVDLDSLLRDIMQYRLEKGLVEVVAVSAHELTPEVIKDIETLLKEHFPGSKHVFIDQHIDESVVGGIRLELPHKTLDLSVRSKLNLFKRLVAEETN